MLTFSLITVIQLLLLSKHMGTIFRTQGDEMIGLSKKVKPVYPGVFGTTSLFCLATCCKQSLCPFYILSILESQYTL